MVIETAAVQQLDTSPNDRPRILCVDDEPLVLRSLAALLGDAYDVRTAAGGEEALETLARQGPFVAIVSDLKMPGLNGAALLAAARQLAPLAVRVLLTGQADVEAAANAVNE